MIRETTQDKWKQAAETMLLRVEATAESLSTHFPHWADSETGEWTTTPDGDWTGGAWPGMLWLAYRVTGADHFRDHAREWCTRLKPRSGLNTAFKGFGFYYGAALGQILNDDATGVPMALDAAASLRSQFNPQLGIIPLGRDAEEANEVGERFSSIDSLQATPLLYWASDQTEDESFARCAKYHTQRVLEIHCRADGSIVQSSEVAADKVLRYFTHKGFSDTSVWARAQAWGILYSAMAYARDKQQINWLQQSMASADWWLSKVPDSMVSFWDFDDPAIPNTERDTAATAIVCASLLKLSALAPQSDQRGRYRVAAEQTADALISDYLTPTHPGDTRPPGMLVGGCFTKRPNSRSSDAVVNAELIFGSYFLFEALLILSGALRPDEV